MRAIGAIFPYGRVHREDPKSPKDPKNGHAAGPYRRQNGPAWCKVRTLPDTASQVRCGLGQASKALWWWLVALAVVAAVAVAAVWDRAGTAARLRREFGLDRTEASSEEAVAAGLQRRVPLGSDRRTIELFLRQSLDGDKHSMVEFVDQGREHRGYLCTFGYDVAEVGLVKETYHIWFAIDDAGVLKGISVTKTLTGL